MPSKGLLQCYQNMHNIVNIPRLDSKDFIFTFGSKGTSFVFEDFVSKYYMTGEWLKIYRDGSIRVFVSRETIKEMNNEGLKRSTGDTEQIIRSFRKLVKESLDARNTIKDLSRESVATFLELMGRIAEVYHYFDIHYWDAVYDSEERNTEAKENSSLVQHFKNVIRDELNPVFFNTNSCLDQLMNALSENFNIPKETLLWYLHAELLELFEGNVVNENLIQERQTGHIVYSRQSRVYEIYTGKHVFEVMKEFERLNNTYSIKGRVAHGKGKRLTGRVKIIHRRYDDEALTQKEMETMREGDILVTETTDPSLMPAIAKAAAIITDIGGLLSHAAISARELDIPCLIETGSASKLLKNGDLVEIDMDKGEVRVITKI